MAWNYVNPVVCMDDCVRHLQTLVDNSSSELIISKGFWSRAPEIALNLWGYFIWKKAIHFRYTFISFKWITYGDRFLDTTGLEMIKVCVV
jgi:hypothetical protein